MAVLSRTLTCWLLSVAAASVLDARPIVRPLPLARAPVTRGPALPPPIPPLAPPVLPRPLIPVGLQIGAFDVELPNREDFILRGTLPLPPSMYPRIDNLNPFALLDYDGTPVPCQVEVVSRYPRHGAEVVELIARVRRDPALAPGTRTTYKVAVAPTFDVLPPAVAGVADLVDAPVNLPVDVAQLLGDPSSLELAARDVFGHRYSTRLLAPKGGVEGERYGNVHTQVRTYDVLRADAPVGGGSGTLPHLMGVHAYVSALSGEHVVLLDLRVHNGFDAADGSDPADDQVGRLYWDKLELVVPKGWVLQQATDDPFWGVSAPISSGTKTTYRIVEPLPGNALHVMDVGAQFHRRLALCRPGYAAEARELLDHAGLGFAIRGKNPATGRPYLSWWNPLTARYFPQSFILPSLDHVGLVTLRNQLAGELSALASRMADGTGTGSYPINAGVLGWAHPYGNPYGGMTSGNEINIWQGVRTACAAEVDGYRRLEITHRMHTDRQPNVVYAKDGDPTRLEDWLKGPTNAPYVDFQYFGKVIQGDPFDYASAPTFQESAVAAQNRQPPYEAQLLSFEPHDQSHMVRYTRSPKTLVWLGNDRLACDDIEMQAEVSRLNYHPYPNSSGGYLQQSSMAWDIDYTKTYPNAGFRFGRFEGWVIDTVNAAYATGDDAFRTTVAPWYDEIRDMVVNGQASCSGFLQANISPQFLNGLYRARNNIEQAIAENALRGAIECRYVYEDPASAVMLHDVLARSCRSWFNVMAWDPSKKGPWAKAAVGPLDETLPPWCNTVPPNGDDGIVDTYQLWSSMAYGFFETSDPIFFAASNVMLGGSGSLLTRLQNQGTSNIENRSAMLALVQYVNGVL